MLRPASLLSTEWTFDAPLGRSTSLPSPGACYRALRRLPGQDSHLLEERVFQDAPCSNSNDPRGGTGRTGHRHFWPVAEVGQAIVFFGLSLPAEARVYIMLPEEPAYG